MTIEELQIKITAQTSGLQKEIEKSKNQVNSLSSTVTKASSSIKTAFKAIGAAIAAAGIGKLIMDGVKSAATMEAGIEQLSRTMGSNSREFLNWVNNQATGFGIATADAIKYGMTFSNMVSGFTTGTQQTTGLTIQLLQAAAIVASKTGRTIEDVMERMRSGMLGSTEAIEDLGIYTKVSAIEQTQAFKMMSNGTPWSQLDYNQQQAITAYAILEQSAAKYGNTLSNNVSTQMMILKAQLKNLSTSLGQAFLPIAQAVIPYLMQLVQWLQVAITYIAAFIRVLFGVKDTTVDVADDTGTIKDNLKSSVVSAVALKNALMGFDEINTLPSSSGTGTSSGTGATSTPSLDTSLTDNLDNFNTKIGEIQGEVEAALESFKKWLPVLVAVSAIIAAIIAILNWTTIVAGIASVTASIGAFAGSFVALLPVIAIVAVVIAAIAAVGAAIVELWNTDSEFQSNMIYTWNSIKDTVKGINDNYLKPIFEGIASAAMNIWYRGLKPLWDAFVPFINQLTGFITDLWNRLLKPIFDWLVKTFGPIIEKVVGTLAKDWSNAFNIVISVITGVFNGLAAFLAGMRKALEGVIDFITGVFTGNWTKAWNGIKNLFTGIFEGVGGFFIEIFRAPFNTIVDLINQAFSKINGMKISLFGTQIMLPTIPRLARGGIVDSGTIFMAGEAGKEAVMPLENNTGWITELASKLNGSGSRADGPIEITLQVGSTELGRVVIDSINKLTRQEGRLLLNV
jgi:phage-related protein